MQRMRTIEETYHYIKQQDPDTAITKYALRQMVINHIIPSVMSGKKYLINIDMLDKYLEAPEAMKEPAPQIGVIRPIAER